MKTAEELRKIAEENAPAFFKSFLPDKGYVMECCELRAREGLSFYSYYVRVLDGFPRKVLLDCCIDYIR